MNKTGIVSLLLVVSFFAGCNKTGSKFNPVDYVDPFIGTDYHGHVFLGANVPYGAVQLGPTNFVKGWDWCSGYHYSDSIVTGFSHTHLSGTGIGDLGDILVMPYTGSLRLEPGSQEDISKGYASKYSHKTEIAKPGYYQVILDSYGIKVELTASERAGFHCYKFPEADTARIIIDLKQGIGWDKAVNTDLKIKNKKAIWGYRFSKGWASDQRIFFALKTSAKADSIQFFDSSGNLLAENDSVKALKGVLTFYPPIKSEILLKVGISPVSKENALDNLDTEFPDWDFNKAAVRAITNWNSELSKISVSSTDTSELRTFYTAMYHLMMHPSLFNDTKGDYRGTDKKIYPPPGFNNYTVFSLWDTYRAAHPLFTIIDPVRVNDFVKSMLAIYEQQGSLPVWHLMGNETGTMVGNHSIPVIADAILKGIGDFDYKKAYEAMRKTATSDDGDGLKFVNRIGWVAADSTRESVSKGLEYAIDDWAVAQVAKLLGTDKEAAGFSKRAGYYRNYWDPSTGFFRGKKFDGTWTEPFHPKYTLHEQGNYTEGNAWQYLWLVPTDVEGLIELMGGDVKFSQRLDSLFTISSDLNEGASIDISGMIGQYAHGNEPSHHISYLYAFAGQQWKTAEKVRYIMDHLYSDRPDGLCGNEDCGQMSAWYIFSSLGFYPVNPANSVYVLGSPLLIKLPFTWEKAESLL